MISENGTTKTPHRYSYGRFFINTRQITCSVQNLTNWLYNRLPFIKKMDWEKIEWTGETFSVTLNCIPYCLVFVDADKETIQQWWKKIDWRNTEWRNTGNRRDSYNLCSCFTPYANIATYMYPSRVYFDNDEILLYMDIPVLIFPQEIEGEDLRSFVQNSKNANLAIEGIMGCEQVKNIINYIFLSKTQYSDFNTKDDIQKEYEQLIHDFIKAIRD